MPFTPYHFGPAGFIALALRKWIDIPVFILANVVVDVEVLIIWTFGLGRPFHRYNHTLLIGVAVGILWGLVAWPLRGAFKRIMHILRIRYTTSLAKMLISGILGVWLHVLIDGIYHFDVRVFWPSKSIALWRMTRQHLDGEQIETICLWFFPAAAALYALAVISFVKKKKIQNANTGK